MRRNKGMFFILLLGLAFRACVDPFVPELDEGTDALVVEALITDQAGMQSVRLSRSAQLGDSLFPAVTGARVSIEDGAGVSLVFEEKDPGNYCRAFAAGDMDAEKAYSLRIRLNDGTEYLSDEESFPGPCPAVDSVYWQFEEREQDDPDQALTGIAFYLDLEGGDGGPTHYRWVLEETWEEQAAYFIQYVYDGALEQWEDPFSYYRCWRTEQIGQIFTASTSTLRVNRISAQPLHFVSTETPRLQRGYSLLVRQYALNDRAYAYWAQVATLNQEGEGLYQTQPGPVPSNIKNPGRDDETVLGFFNLCSSSEKRIFVQGIPELWYPPIDCQLDTITSPEQKPPGLLEPFFLISLSPMGSGPPYGVGTELCFDCRAGGGSIEKPVYWIWE